MRERDPHTGSRRQAHQQGSSRSSADNACRPPLASSEEAGFTLPELLVALLVMAIVVGGAWTLTSLLFRAAHGSVARAEAVDTLLSAFRALDRDLAQARCVTLAADSTLLLALPADTVAWQHDSTLVRDAQWGRAQDADAQAPGSRRRFGAVRLSVEAQENLRTETAGGRWRQPEHALPGRTAAPSSSQGSQQCLPRVTVALARQGRDHPLALTYHAPPAQHGWTTTAPSSQRAEHAHSLP